MKTSTLRPIAALSVCLLAFVALPNNPTRADEPFDVNKAKAVMTKFKAGETLTPDEQAYLQRVREEIQKRNQGNGGNPSGKGEDGGLYGGGSNEPPVAHRAAYLQEAAKIAPFDADGKPSPDGKIGFITIGFSNPSIESEAFKRAADADAQKAPNITIVNGCIGGRSAAMWAWDGADIFPAAEQERLDKEMDVLGMPKHNRKSSPGLDKDTWPTLAKRIETAGLAPQQVQVLWLKHVEANPKPLGEFPAHAKALQADITDVLTIARHHYPNLRVAYLSSRTFGGWSSRDSGSPEPYAYESGFGTRWIIQAQIKGDPQLNYDPARGEVKVPLLLWGPYLWAQGNTPRKLDGLTWTVNDVRADHLHPNDSGCAKTTTLLLNFLKTDPGASRWFVKAGEKAEAVPLPK
jgi:hypothetical protein